MKNTFLKIILYTLAFMLIIDLYKIFIQNPLFHDDYSTGYLIAMTILKVSLFALTLFLLNNEKIRISNFNKNKYILIIAGAIIVLRLCQNVISKSAGLKIEIDYFRLTFYGLHNLFTGLFEEFYFRLLVFSLLCSFYKKNVFKIAILTSLLFAAVHISNLILDSYTFNDVLFQIMFAFATGLFLQIVFINSKNIFIPSVIHFFIDFNAGFSEKFFNASNREDYNEGFDYTTFTIVSVLIILSLIFAYFNLKNKDAGYFEIRVD